MSGAPPGGMGTTILIGREGYPCAGALGAAQKSAAPRASACVRCFMTPLAERGRRAQRRGDRPRAPEQLLPQRVARVLAEDHLLVGVEHVPKAAVDFLAQLARTPGDVADEIA